MPRKQQIAMIHAMEATIAVPIRTHTYFKSMKQWPSLSFAKRCGSVFSQHPCRAIIHHSLPPTINLKEDITLSHQINVKEDITLSYQLSICRETAFSPTNYQSEGNSWWQKKLSPIRFIVGEESLQIDNRKLSTCILIVGGRESCLPVD